jgi:hypothetical protein
LPEVVIGDSSPVAVAAPPDGSPAALPPSALRHRAHAPGRWQGLRHHHRGVAAQTDAGETVLYVAVEAGTEDLVCMLLPLYDFEGALPTQPPCLPRRSQDCGRISG